MKAGDVVVWMAEGKRPKAVRYVGLTSSGLVVLELDSWTRSVPLHEVFVRAEAK